MTHLFLFTIGPVQSFISQARKTRDLYAGSLLLSQLIRHAWETTRKIVGEENVDPIIPDLRGTAKAIPNRFLLAVKVADDQAAIQLGKDVSKEVKSELLRVAQSTLASRTQIEQLSETFNTLFEQQIQDHLEVYWVFEPWTGKQESYLAAYERIESTMGSIKSTRIFSQLPEENSRKCSVTGERDALFFSKIPLTSKRKPRRFISPHAIVIEEHESQLSEGEGLSAIAFTKRFFAKENFQSTADIALLDYYEKLGKDTIEAYKDELDLIPRSEIDGQLFFEENLTVKNLDQFRKFRKIKELGDKQLKIKSYKKALQELDKEFPQIVKREYHHQTGKASSGSARKSPYYALIKFDGDKMGSWWGGQMVQTEDLKRFQTNLTQLLSEYAKQIEQYLNTPKGESVYTGGDDFLGFINLQSLFEVLKTLRHDFRTTVNNHIPDKPDDLELTFSAGVVIAHYKTPLNIVLDTARSLEKLAKDQGRNRLGIKVLKHSGESNQAILTWEELPMLERITHDLLESVSSKFISDLGAEMYHLFGLDSDQSKRTPMDYELEIFESEIRRLVTKRKSVQTYDPRSLTEIIVSLYTARNTNPKDLIELLSIAMFIERESYYLPQQHHA